MCILILFVSLLNVKIAGSNISFITPRLSGKYEKVRILNEEYQIK